MTETDRERIERVHERLAATAERPIDPAASRWLGEAEAVAADAVALARREDVDEQALERRLDQLQELLSHVGETGHPDADEDVAEARELVEQVRET